VERLKIGDGKREGRDSVRGDWCGRGDG